MATPVPLVALITAGSAGLGAATAKVFASAGHRVIINYANNADRAASLVSELQKLSPLKDGQKSAISLKGDLGSKTDIAKLVEESVKEMGRLDVVFSNGGWTRIVDFKNLEENMDEGDWDRCYNMNVKSHLWLFHASRKYLEESEGAFITTASTAGVKPSGSSLVCQFCRTTALSFLTSSTAVLGHKGGSNSSCEGSSSHRSTQDPSQFSISIADDDGTHPTASFL